MSTPATVIVGMSGGVDSSVAALLLLRAGYRVQGLFMKNWEEEDGSDWCTALADFEDAARVCDRLRIELHTASFAAEYWNNVFEAFLEAYRAGRTPNPDVLCNREIKFKQFARYARTLGADRIATGHYARACTGPDGFELHKAVDLNKDQTYFLQAVTRDQFAGTLFPLGELHKPAVRELARSAGFENHRKKDSTGICFIGEHRFRDFLARYVRAERGPIMDTRGRAVGEHAGLAYYTLGQRQGLGIGGRSDAAQRPWYVCGKDPHTNRLIVTQDEHDLLSSWLAAEDENWLDIPSLPIRCAAKVRYRQPDKPCTLSRRADGRLLARFDEPQRAVTPGQHACFYLGDRVLGGARITSTEAAA